MADTGISSMILTIAAISIAVLITGAMFTVSVNLSENIERSSNSVTDTMLREFTIIHASNVNSSDENITIFVINTGSISIPRTSLIVLYNSEFVYFNSSDGSHYWQHFWPGQSTPNSYFDPGELLEVVVVLSEGRTFGVGSHTITMSADGYVDEIWFST